jgi:hypothetical protein
VLRRRRRRRAATPDMQASKRNMAIYQSRSIGRGIEWYVSA